MKIAYIVDGSTELSPSTKNLKNIHILPFKSYSESGTQVEISNINFLLELQTMKEKHYLEPTPGNYRDLYKSLLSVGYDYVVCIPQNRERSSSYKFAEYASRFYKDSVLVIDATDYKLEPIDILLNLLSNQKIKDDSYTLGFTFEQLFDLVKKVLTKVNLITT